MKTFIESQYRVEFIEWATPTDDGEGVRFVALVAGRLIVAESLALMLSALQERTHTPLRLAA